MSVEKCDAVLEAIESLGNEADDLLESYERGKYRHMGEGQGLQLAQDAFKTLVTLCDKECGEGVIPEEVSIHVRRYLGRAQTMLEQLQRRSVNTTLILNGKIEAQTHTVAALKKRKEAVLRSREQQESREQNPPESLKEQRRREEAEEAGSPPSEVDAIHT